MFSHPVSVVGYFVTAFVAILFWAEPLLLMMSGVGFSIFAYILAAAGPFLILLGVIAAGFNEMKRSLPQITQAVEHQAPKPTLHNSIDSSRGVQTDHRASGAIFRDV
jgi:hypothetical protein